MSVACFLGISICVASNCMDRQVSSPAVVTTPVLHRGESTIRGWGNCQQQATCVFSVAADVSYRAPSRPSTFGKEARGEILVVPGLNGLSGKKRGADKVTAPWEVRSRRF